MQAMTNVVYPMHTHHIWYVQALANFAWHWQTSFSIYALVTSDGYRPWAMSHVIDRCAQAKTDIAQSMRTHTFDSCRPWMMMTNVGKFHLPTRTSDGRRTWLISSFVVDTCMPRSISPNWCAHATSDACKPWPILLVVVHTPCLTRACFCRCFLTSADIVFHMHTCYIDVFRP